MSISADPPEVGAWAAEGGPADALADLTLGARCVGCQRPGRLLCPRCRAGLPAHAVSVRPTPAPPGLAPAFAMGSYDATLQALVVGFKEQGLWGLRGPLAELLAGSVCGAESTLGLPGTIVLVPMPSRAASVRARAMDTTWSITKAAARLLQGDQVIAAPLLRMRPGVIDQAGLGTAARRTNLARAMTCPSTGLRRLARRADRVTVVLCDDVITTGASAIEAQRALAAVGLPVAAIATVAATVRRHPARDSQ